MVHKNICILFCFFGYCVYYGSSLWSMSMLEYDSLMNETLKLFVGMANIFSHVWKLPMIIFFLIWKLMKFGSQSSHVNFDFIHLYVTTLVNWTCWISPLDRGIAYVCHFFLWANVCVSWYSYHLHLCTHYFFYIHGRVPLAWIVNSPFNGCSYDTFYIVLFLDCARTSSQSYIHIRRNDPFDVMGPNFWKTSINIRGIFRCKMGLLREIIK